MSQLKSDILRTSQILYDVTNGQAALGNINIYHDKGYAGHADIVIRANNNQRPGAILGGVVLTPTDDVGITNLDLDVTGIISNAYLPGQISMGPTWNRFGNPDGVLGEDWPRTLAHELGHYLFYLPDNYLGLSQGETDEYFLDMIDCAGSFMTDPYLEDYSEALSGPEWIGPCENTLAEIYLGRDDWETIQTFYPYLRAPQTLSTINSGPHQLPLAVTTIRTYAPDTPTTTLADPFFNLVDESGQTLTIPQGRGEAYLIKTLGNSDPTDDTIISLGSPIGDKVHARGVSANDTLCVFDFSRLNATSAPSLRAGCETVTDSGDLTLRQINDWTPEIQVSGVDTNTVTVSVNNAPPAADLYAQILPAIGAASAEVAMEPSSADNTSFTQTITAPDGTYFGFVRVWDNANPDREIISEYLLVEDWGGKAYSWGTPLDPWANPAGAWGGKAYSWGGKAYSWGGKAYSWGAPIMSSDGQVSVFPLENLFGQQLDYTVQRLDIPPTLHPWLTPVGRAYRVDREGSMLPDSSILFRYLAREVPAGYESAQFMSVYYSGDEGQTWDKLDSLVNTEINHVSAKVAGTGIYMLAITVELMEMQVGWNQVPYTVLVSPTLSVPDALQSIAGSYTSVYNCSPGRTPAWQLYDATVLSTYADAVNDLTAMNYGQTYWIYAEQEAILYLGVSSPASPAQETAVSLCQLPPTTFYGEVSSEGGLTAAEGDVITAEIDGNVCGQAEIDLLGGNLVYSIQVRAEDLLGPPDGCGAFGRTIQFKLNGVLIEGSSRLWDNSAAWNHPLNGTPSGVEIFLPLMMR